MASLSGRSGTEGMTLDPSGLSEAAATPAFGEVGSADGGSLWNARSFVMAAAMVVFLHAVASFTFPRNGSLNCLAIGGCYGVAGFAAYQTSLRSSGVMQARWRWMTIGLGFGVIAVTLPLYQDSVFNFPEPGAGMQDVALLLRGLPFLAAVCLTKRELETTFTVLDVAQFVLVASFGSFALLFATPDYSPVSSSAALFWITTANVVAASLASVRCFDGADGEERRFFQLVAVFLWVLTLTTEWMNFYSIRHREMTTGATVHLVCDLPLLVLTAALATRTSVKARAECTSEARLVDTVCSLFIPACGLLLAASIVPSHLRLGLSAVAVAFVLYGVRSSVVLKKSLAAQQELLLANRSILDQAFSDALTGIPNRRSFDLTLEREWKRAQRSRQPLALLMIDVDHFKSLNDEHGHLGGDTCLRQIAGLLRSGLGREADFAARYGGEEFAILLVDTGIEGARTVGESLRRTVEFHHCALEDGVPVSFTISVGIASEVPMVQESSATLVAAADKALYRAKRSGRNRVEVHAWQTELCPMSRQG